ncbi:TIR domain-containing protein [Methyloferula stellata]|uniref:TIR domain-containing protein n=1 Tax=Methyloferula stellata TaxID=876270 RepID=UPI00035C9588|nr:nucleotide-binding protein [Methyloferula stellata]
MIDDAEIRGWLLKHFHGLRNDNGGWVPTDETILSPHPVSRAAIANACQHLAEAGYILWEPFLVVQHTIGRAKITGPGIDVVTGSRMPAIDIRFPGMEEHGVRSALASPATLSGAISAEGRRVRFEQWERLGLDRVKADLANGGHQIIGGPPAVRELAWEWVSIKDAEQEGRSMARQPKSLAPPQAAKLTPQQMQAGITRLTKRLDEVKAFNPQSVTDQFNAPELDALEAAVDAALVDTFGSDTADYHRYRQAKDFDRGPYNMSYPTPPDEFQASIARSIGISAALLKQAIKSLEEKLEEQSGFELNPAREMAAIPNLSRKVFIVHGRDDGTKNEVALFISAIGLEPIILHMRPNKGRHLLTKFQEESEGAQFAIVLLTPDDEGGIAGAGNVQKRARQNVIFELGFFIGKLGPENVAALLKGNVEKPSDFDGVAYISMDDTGGWKGILARELHEAKLPFDPAKVFTA